MLEPQGRLKGVVFKVETAIEHYLFNTTPESVPSQSVTAVVNVTLSLSRTFIV